MELNYHSKQLVPVRSLLPHYHSEQSSLRTLIIFRLWGRGVSTKTLAIFFGIKRSRVNYLIYHARYYTYGRLRRWRF